MEVRKKLQLEGLKCAGCAAEIEEEVRNLDGVCSVNMNFVMKQLTMDVRGRKDTDRVVDEVAAIASRIEPGIKVLEVKAGRLKTDEEDQEELIEKRLLVRFIAAILLFGTGLLFDLYIWLEFAIFFASYMLMGGDVLWKAVANISKGRIFDENFLMGTATAGAFAIHEFPEAAAVMLFYQVGSLFQKAAVNRSRRSIRALFNIRPDYANLISGGEIKRVSPEGVAPGDIIIIKPGEKVPLDGLVLEGNSMLDTSALTGESVPREAAEGTGILSGSVNLNGLLTVEVTKNFGESTVSKILDLVQNAGSKKAHTENFITKFARYYTPVVVVSAAALAVIPPLVVPGALFLDWLHRALVFLVVSCPCALVISIPLGFFGGIGGASRKGILIKGGNFLEALNNVDTVVFDKTGTLTKGVFKVIRLWVPDAADTAGVASAAGAACTAGKTHLDKARMLEYAAYAESFSNHPIALSINKAYGSSIDKSRVSNYEELSGLGVKATIDGRTVLAGSTRLMEQQGILPADAGGAGSVVHVAVDGDYAGFIVISDEMKPDSGTAVRALRSLGVRSLVMLTGDVRAAGGNAGRELGLDEVYSELLPAQKVEMVERLKARMPADATLVFAGDGMNDAPVLARADVGVAMGGLGSDAAIEAADVVIMTDEPSKLADAIRIARRTRSIVWQNIILALGVKGIVLLLGAGGIATMWEAVFADVGVAVLAILNAMRVMREGA